MPVLRPPLHPGPGVCLSRALCGHREVVRSAYQRRQVRVLRRGRGLPPVEDWPLLLPIRDLPGVGQLTEIFSGLLDLLLFLFYPYSTT